MRQISSSPTSGETAGGHALTSVDLALIQQWPKYDTAIYAIPNSPIRLVWRKGEFVAAVGSFYKLVPLEESKELVSEAISQLGLREVKVEETKTRLYVFHLDKREFNFKDGSRVSIGIYTLNSIDGSTRIAFDLFTYRDICKNVAMLAINKLAKGATLSELKKVVKDHRGENADFGPVAHLNATHTNKGVLEWQKFRNKISSLLRLGEKVIEIYRRWEELKLAEEEAQKLAESRIPKKILKDVGFEFNKEGELEDYPKESLWNVYNGLTQQIWHSNTNIKTKHHLFSELHKALLAPELEVRV